MSYEEYIHSCNGSTRLQIGHQHRGRPASSVRVKPERLVGGAEDEAVVAVLREVVAAALELRGGQRSARHKTSSEAGRADAEDVVVAGHVAEVRDDVAPLRTAVELEGVVACSPGDSSERYEGRGLP